jgi:hypothetical protein
MDWSREIQNRGNRGIGGHLALLHLAEALVGAPRGLQPGSELLGLLFGSKKLNRGAVLVRSRTVARVQFSDQDWLNRELLSLANPGRKQCKGEDETSRDC